MKHIKKLGIGFIIIITLGFVVMEQQNKNAVEKVNNTVVKEESTSSTEDKKTTKSKKTARDVYERIHVMTNSEVVSPNEENEGMIPINKKNIDGLEKMMVNSDMDTDQKDYLKEVLTKWRKEDFSNVIEVHDKAVRELGGNDFATEIRGANIIIEGLFYDKNPQTVETAMRIILEELPKDVVELERIEDEEFGATFIIYSSKETGKKYKARIGYHRDEVDINAYDRSKVLAITLEEIVS